MVCPTSEGGHSPRLRCIRLRRRRNKGGYTYNLHLNYIILSLILCLYKLLVLVKKLLNVTCFSYTYYFSLCKSLKKNEIVFYYFPRILEKTYFP